MEIWQENTAVEKPEQYLTPLARKLLQKSLQNVSQPGVQVFTRILAQCPLVTHQVLDVSVVVGSAIAFLVVRVGSDAGGACL